MTCRNEVVNARTFRYCPDDLPPPADRIQAIMVGRFVDELSGNALNSVISVSTGLVNVSARASANAVAGLVANPARRFPGLAVSTVTLDMTISSRRYLSWHLQGDLGPFNTGAGAPADFPLYFAPVDLGDVELHREATHISGRCVQNNGVTRQPLDGANVTISGIWHRFPAADVDPLAVIQNPRIVSLVQGLYRGREVGVDQAQRRQLLPLAGNEKVLLLPAQAGELELRLSDQVNLNVGDILGMEIDHADKVEYIEVAAINGTLGLDQPATVSLAYPLHQDHRAAMQAVPMSPQAAATALQFTRNAITGDQTLFLDALTDIDDTVLEISGGGRPEYHAVQRYSVDSDPEGYYRLPPISRVAMMQITASHPLPAANVTITFSPDYDQFGNRADLVFS